ncbi:efflux RND transporter permease subunit [Dokdonella sp.]|uniref:efflux RND transporter permease subunit n=1 Tax=Dokdonella sp. TaxID=2291710 RepID=UPI0037839C15
MSGFNLSAWALRQRALVVYLMAAVALLGLYGYLHLGRSEDPPFTFKVMVIQTAWPGATARQVQEQISDRIARKLQETPDVDFVTSYSRPAESVVMFAIRDSAPSANVPATWYQVRKKIGDIAAQLPQGVQGPFFNDEFGDVYTNIWALEGDGSSPAELRDYADTIRTELLRVAGVAKVDYFGDQEQRITIEIDNARLATLGITPLQLGTAIAAQNAVAPAGTLEAAEDRIFVRPSGQFGDVAALRETSLRIGDKLFRLGDVAEVRRGYVDPPVEEVRYGGRPALAIGVTMQPGGDVVELGHALDATIARLRTGLPAGLALNEYSSMPAAVEHSLDDFLEAVAEAVLIVLLVSLASLGFRTGMVVAITIPFVLAATALGMWWFGIGLHKVSLGTLILALGLLVDDAIIAIEMMAVKLEEGWDRMRAASFAYTSTAFPMLTGTLVTVAGFLPIALAKSGTGEYTRSIFQVSAIALVASWIAAVVVIPVLGHAMLPEAHHPPSRFATWLRERVLRRGAAAATHGVDPYDRAFYHRFGALIAWCVDHRWRVLAATLALWLVSIGAFALVPQQFFPSSDRSELLIDLRLGEGASIAATRAVAARMEHELAADKDVDHFVAYVGAGAPRFYLPLDQQLPRANFAQVVATARDVEARKRLEKRVQQVLDERFPDVSGRVSALENGPPVGFPVQFRVSGDDIGKVRAIAEEVEHVMRADAGTANVQFDWDEPSTRSIRLDIDQDKARVLGLTSQDVAAAVNLALSGAPVTQYRERDKLIVVDLRWPQAQRVDAERLGDLAIATPAGKTVPLTQIARIDQAMDYGVVWERDRQPTITVRSDTAAGRLGIDVTHSVDAKLGELRAKLPIGYRIEVGGAVENSAKAQASINAQMPVMLLAVLTLLMIQLRSFSRTLMVVLTAPLGLIGVVGALLLFGQPFGFVAMLGTIAMFGIIMRNSVILIDQIEQDIGEGHSAYEAIQRAVVRRFRPITLTAAAAVLALIPLLRSNFFGPMATALMGGITVATVLTLLYLPALYAIWFRVPAAISSPARSA